MSFHLERRRLYGILDMGYVTPAEVQRVANEMLLGGVEILQLRAKEWKPLEIVKIASTLAPICQSFGVPFVLNDHPALVPDSGADGVHIGQDDVFVEEARTLAGPEKIVGLSTHSILQAKSAVDEAPDYIGFGPLFSTPTKPDYKAIGTANIREVHRIVPMPIFCIGGIKLGNLADVLAAGATRVVVVSGILQAEHICDYCRACRAALS
ncbi:MAG: thiamine phosphate synthase [bacterium]